MDVKKQPKFINSNLSGRPILIVGEKLGKQRSGQATYALEGNRTGDFVHEVIEGIEHPIILTNVVNWYYEGGWTGKYLDEGLQDLDELICTWEPSLIVTLGGIAKKYIDILDNRGFPTFNQYTIKMYNFPHPSWINRFKSSERSDYVKKLRHEIITRIRTHQGMGA